MSLGDKLIELRKKQGWSQDDLAIKMGVSRQSISKWELNEYEPSLTKLKLLAEIFNVAIADLIYDEKTFNKEESNVENKEEKIIETKVIEKSTIIKEFNCWIVFFIFGVLGIATCVVVAYTCPHHACYSLNSGLHVYLFIDWCIEAVIWKIGLILSITFLLIGIKKVFFKSQKGDKNEHQRRSRKL